MSQPEAQPTLKDVEAVVAAMARVEVGETSAGADAGRAAVTPVPTAIEQSLIAAGLTGGSQPLPVLTDRVEEDVEEVGSPMWTEDHLGWSPRKFPDPVVSQAEIALRENNDLLKKQLEQSQAVITILLSNAEPIKAAKEKGEDVSLAMRLHAKKIMLSRLLGEVPDFTGEQDHNDYLENFKKFSSMLQRLNDCAEFDGADKIRFITQKLKGQAYVWWVEGTQSFDSEESALVNIPLERFIGEFTKKFTPRFPLYKLYKKLGNLRQGSMGTIKWAQEFRRVAGMVPRADSATLAYMFLESLRAEVSRRLRSQGKDLENFVDLVDLAIKTSEGEEKMVDQQTALAQVASVRGIREFPINYHVQRAETGGGKCYNCGLAGHYAYVCPQRGQPTPRNGNNNRGGKKSNKSRPNKKFANAQGQLVSSTQGLAGKSVAMASAIKTNVYTSLVFNESGNITSTNGITFVVDSGAERHIVQQETVALLGLETVESSVIVVTADGAEHLSREMKLDKLDLFFNENCIVLNKPLVLNNFCDNLLSVPCLNQYGYTVEFDSSGVILVKKNDAVIAETLKSNGLSRKLVLSAVSQPINKMLSRRKRRRHPEYTGAVQMTNVGLDVVEQSGSYARLLGVRETLKECYASDELCAELQSHKEDHIDDKVMVEDERCEDVVKYENLTLIQWHDVLGHANPAKVQQFLKLRLGKVIFVPKVFNCEACQLGKFTIRKPSVSLSGSIRHAFAEVVHMDICGPISQNSLGGKRYILNLIEDHSRYVKAYLLANKDAESVVTCIEEFILWIKIQTGVSVKILRSDNGTEFVNETLREVCRKNGLVHQRTNPYNPHQNGTIERVQRTLMETVRTWLVATKFPLHLWGELYMHAVRVYNLRPHGSLQGMVPAIVLLGRDHILSKLEAQYFLPLGSKVIISTPKEKRSSKLLPVARIGWYLGAAAGEPGVRGWDDETKSVFGSSQFKAFPNERFIPGNENIDDTEQPDRRIFGILNDEDHEYVIEKIVDEKIDESGECRYRVRWEGYTDDDDTWERRETLQETQALLDWDIPQVQDVLAYGVSEKSDMIKNLTVSEALESKDHDKWRAAMDAEYSSIMEQGTWIIVPRPIGRKVISLKWVLTIKWNVDRTVPQFKARLVARGFTQIAGVDYDTTYSPTLSRAGLRLVVAIAVQFSLKLHAIDCKNAFLNGEMDREIYLEQPLGFEEVNTTCSTHVCLLKKALYGLKQAPLIWNQTLHVALEKVHFYRLEYEPCIYVFRSGYKRDARKKESATFSLTTIDKVVKDQYFCILAVYVDDITIASPTDDGINFAKTTIHGLFKIKDEGPVRKIIGTEFLALSNGLFLHQEQYATDILVRNKMSECNERKIPMDPHPNVGPVQMGEEVSCNTEYRQKIGELLYTATCTRPDLCISVNMCARHVENPTTRHSGLVKGILRYLRRSSDTGLLYLKKDQPVHLVAFTDSDFAGDHSDSKSTSGYVILLNGCCVSWRTTKQKCIATSTVEAEYMAASLAAKELMWLQELLKEVLNTCDVQVPILYIDNAGAEMLAKNSAMSEKTKHIRYTYHFLRECVRDKVIDIRHVASAENPADMMTKPLAFEKFNYFKGLAGVFSMREVLDREAKIRLARFVRK